MSQITKRSIAFGVLQKIGQSLMIPVSVLPAAGLLVALGRLIQNMSEDAASVITHPIIHAIGKIFFSGGLAIFEQLPLVFCIGVAIGFTSGAGVAGLAAAVGYFTMINVIKVVSEALGVELVVNTGVFGGIIMGLISASLYNRFSNTQLPQVFGFFSGKRLVPIITAASALLVGVVLAFVWPPIQEQIKALGELAMGSQFGPAFYAAGKRLLIPVGLHHVYYPPFLFEFGSYTLPSGEVLRGESARFFAGDPTAGRFMASEFPIMLFGLPAAALAIVMRAQKSKRKAVAGVMLSAALTSIITGITEPIEFAFIFVAPLLYVLHVGFAFASGFLTGLFDIHLGYTFSASIIDYALGFFNQKNSLALFTVIGPIMFALYFTSFYWIIGMMNYLTPGREADENEENSDSNVTASNKAQEVLIALGGATNIKSIDACITRLRLAVKDLSIVNKSRLMQLGAAGVMDAGGGNLQVVFGVSSDHLKEEIKTLMSGGTIATPKTSSTKTSKKEAIKSAEAVILKSPASGQLVSMENVPDATFSEKLLGDGIAIDPSEGVIYAPIDSKVTHLFPTLHAIGLTTSTGVEMLIHIGLDTVKLKGRGFKSYVKNGDSVKAGQKLIEFDLETLKKEVKSMITPMVITNSTSQNGFLNLSKNEKIKAHEDLLSINP